MQQQTRQWRAHVRPLLRSGSPTRNPESPTHMMSTPGSGTCKRWCLDTFPFRKSGEKAGGVPGQLHQQHHRRQQVALLDACPPNSISQDMLNLLCSTRMTEWW
jgi:hypothetical protein